MNKGILHIIIGSMLGLIVLVSVSFTGKTSSNRTIQEVEIDIRDQAGNYFITHEEVEHLIAEGAGFIIEGAPQQEVSLKAIENSIETHKFVKNAEVFRDIRGKVKVEIEQRRPIARIVQANGPHAYIGADGHLLPVIESYTARVNLVSGPYARKLLKNDLHQSQYGLQLLNLLQTISADTFWEAQLAQLDIDSKGNIDIYSQVSKQVIEFGQPENIGYKLKKLKVFYENILPRSGWNTYERVNVIYSNQIICE